jgi:trans-aconitate methyltransferase
MNFDEKAHIWESISVSQQQAANDLLRLLDIDHNDVVLDAGCGTGYLTEKLFLLSKKTHGIDISKNMVDVASKLRPYIEFQLGNVEELNKLNHYDWIITNAVTYYFNDIPSTFKKFHDALKFGGKYALQSQVLRTPEFTKAFIKLEQDGITAPIFSTFKLPTTILDMPALIKILEDQDFTVRSSKLITNAVIRLIVRN